MGRLSNYAEQKLIDHFLNKVAFTGPSTYISLFITVPAEDGTGGVEVSGGSYARVQVFENASASTPKWNLGVSEGTGRQHGYLVDNIQEIAFAAATADWGIVKGIGFYDAVSAGNPLLISHLIKSPKAFVGLAVDNKLYAIAHGFANDQRVVFINEGSGSLPTGLTEGTEYYIINASSNDFQVSTTQGGGAVDLTADGDGTVGLSQYQDVRSGNTFKIAAGDLDAALR